MNNSNKSRGSGKIERSKFASLGKNVVIEPGVMMFHLENIYIEDNVYIGHRTIIDANFGGKIILHSGAWIGPQCYINGAGILEIGHKVGIGAGVKIITSSHDITNTKKPIIASPLKRKKVIIGRDSDIGTGAVILSGVEIGHGVQIGAGAVVTKNVPDYEIWAGVPAIKLRKRN